LVDGTMSSDVTEHVGQALTLVNAHMLPEIVVTTEILPASLDRTLVRYNSNTESKSHQDRKR